MPGIAIGCVWGWFLSHHLPNPLFILTPSLTLAKALGDKTARGLIRRRIVELSRGHVEIAQLKQEPDGELVHLRGRVRAGETVTGLLTPLPAVYRRLAFSAYGKEFFHEAAVDFTLVEPNGEGIAVHVEGARLIVEDAKRRRLVGEEIERVEMLPFEPLVGFKVTRAKDLSGAEALIRDGDLVEVVGYKSQFIDPTVTQRLERETPMRALLRGGKDLPLLIAPTIGC